MKNTLLTICVTLVSILSAKAQIPNSGFEDWDVTADFENPTGWATVNGAIIGGGFYPCTKSNDHYPENMGSYSMQLETDLEFQQGGWGISVTDTFAFPFKPAFAIQGHPTSLNGYYKYESDMGDQAWVKLIFFFEGAIVSDGDFVSPAANSNDWESFQVTMPAYTEADSATLMIFNFYPSTPTDGPNGNSVLLVDNLSFNNSSTGLTESAVSSEFAMYPNPTTGQVILKLNTTSQVKRTLNIYNTLGELVLSEAVQNQRQLELSGLSDGIYIAVLQSAAGAIQQKLIVQH